MDFIETQKFLRDDILAALRIPKAMVTTDDVNLANAKEAYRMFLQEAVVPVFEAFLDILNHRLVPQVDKGVFFHFDDPVPADREAMLAEHTAGIGKWLTQNEARAETNRPTLDGDSYDTLGTVSFGGSTQQTPTALKETAKQFLRKRPTLVRKLMAIEELANLTMLSEPKRERNSIFTTRAQKVAYAKAVNDKVDRKATAIKDALDQFHAGMESRILKNDLTPTTFMDVVGEKSAAKALFAPLLVKLYKEFGNEALSALFTKSSEQFAASEVLLASMEARAAFFTGSIVDTTFEILKHKIVDGIASGDGVDKIGQSLRQFFTDMSVGRSNIIARTETSYALSKATNDAYQQSAVVTGKEWINAGDDRVRDEHVDNGGEIVGKDEAFSNGEQYPGEQSVNCRCVLAAAV